jgi:hypothetical protein
MPKNFIKGYALLIGVDENAVPHWSLPDVIKDMVAFRAVLTHPERCGYLEKNVKALTGKEATRENILDGLVWLQDRIKAEKSSNVTVVVYYTGHGWRDAEEKPPDYFLIPYNVSEDQIRSRALRASDFASAIKGLDSQRLLVILDCCHSGGMGVKGASFLPAGYVPAAVPPQLLLGSEKSVSVADGAKGLSELATGAGRAVINSSQAHQLSYIRKDGKMSIFTYHLIEALTGHAQPKENATEVLVTDVMSHVYRNVSQSAKADWGEEQVPDYQLSGNFPVALLLGGKGLPKGKIAPDPLEQTSIPQRSQVVHSPQTTIAGNVEGGVVSGTFDGPVSIGGGNAVDLRGSRDATYIDKKDQRIGTQTNIGRMTGGIVQPGMTVQRDVIQAGRDIIMGDRIKAERDIHQKLNTLFGDVLKQVESLPKEDQRVVKPILESVRDQVVEIQQSGTEDETAPPYGKLKKALKTLVEWVPDIADVVLSFLKDPATGIVSAVRKVAERIKSEMAG